MATTCRHFCFMDRIKKLVRCIDDSNRPDEIPLTHWVKEGEVYTLTGYAFSHTQNCKYFILEEISLHGFGMYGGFSIHRFKEV